MDVVSFADKHRVITKRHEDGETVIPGKCGHIYQHDGSVFGLSLDDTAGDGSLDNMLRSRKRRALAAGFELHQEGDCEATLLFDPTDRQQARLAIRLVGAKRKRKHSPAQLANLRRGPRQARPEALKATISAEAEELVGAREES